MTEVLRLTVASICFLLLGFGLGSWKEEKTFIVSTEGLDRYGAKITDVYDGDTFTADVHLGLGIKSTQRIRLYGVDTPELRGKERKQGLEVAIYVRELLTSNPVLLEVKTTKSGTDRRDKYGRLLAEVYYSDSDGNVINLGQHLKETGRAVEYLLEASE